MALALAVLWGTLLLVPWQEKSSGCKGGRDLGMGGRGLQVQGGQEQSPTCHVVHLQLPQFFLKYRYLYLVPLVYVAAHPTC